MENTQKRLLVCAEDDPDDYHLFCKTASLLDNSLEIIHADNGKILLQKMEQLSKIPCLIILDMNMPIMDGKQTLIAIKENNQWKDIPVAIYTTSPRDRYKHLEQQYGISIVTKPSTYNQVVETVRHLLSFCNSK